MGLANVRVTTASSAGAVHIVALDASVADWVVEQLTDIASLGQEMPREHHRRGAAWQRLSPRMLLVHPLHEVLRELPLLVAVVVFGSATDNQLWVLPLVGLIAVVGVTRWFTTSYRIEPDPEAAGSSFGQVWCAARCCRCLGIEFARWRPTPGRCTVCWV